MFDLIAACAFGLEAVVKRELAALGIEATIGQSGRVHFQGDFSAVDRTNLWLRCADRILIRVAEFPAADFDALFETTKAIAWGQWLPADAEFPVTGRSIKSTLSSVPACQRSVKKAIAEALQRDHATTELPETGANYKIDIALLKDLATITIDTTGRSLHRRGYRTDISKAPLKETLAAALVQLSYWRAGRPLLDPFCGSGTIPIEAALIGRNMAPGLHRAFACESWHNHDAEAMTSLREQAEQQILPALETRLLGSDLDGRALTAARANAQRAGVADDVHFEIGDVADVTSKRRFGCLITNPPYGRRIGRDYEVEELMQTLPDVLRHLPTWSFYFLTALDSFEKQVGRQADRRRKLYNGRIECTYYQFQGPKPVTGSKPDATTSHQPEQEPQTIAPPTTETRPSQPQPFIHAQGEAAFGQLPDKANEQAELFAARLRKRAKHLRRFPTRRGITCFRLYEKDIPEIPLVVDRYEDHLHISEFERPHDRDPAQHANWLQLMADTAGKTLEVAKENVHLKRRGRQRGKSQHERVARTDQRIVVHEGGLKFYVNLTDYIDTGLFLDHRNTRDMVRRQSAGKHFLNLFAYTGSFTTYAAAGGAASTTSVDLSQTYLDWASDNLRLNGLESPIHQMACMDSREFLRRHRPGEAYDLVVFDPPTFSNSKGLREDWNVQSDAPDMINMILPLMRPGGVLFFSTNFRRFQLAPQSIAASSVIEISKQTVPEDFRNRRIHRCWRIEK